MKTPTSFWSTVPRKSTALFLLGVFSLFTTIQFATDIIAMGRQPAPRFILGVLLSGLFAVGYALSGILLRKQSWKAMLPLFALQFLLMAVLGHRFPDLPQPIFSGPATVAHLQHRLTFDAVSTIFAVSLGYSCFFYVSIMEGRRYAHAHAEMRLAAEIHRVLVPSLDTDLHGFEFYGRSFPSGEVGGDLIDVFPHDRGWIAYIADVSGHGVAPGVMMGMVKSAARMHLSSTDKSTALLERLNSVLYPIKKPEMFVTMGYLAWDGEQLEYSLAGHPPMLHFHSATNEISEVASSNLPVAMFSGREFVNGCLRCAPGDLFLLFTDGLLEVANARDEEFGLDAIKNILYKCATGPLADTVQAILDANNHHGLATDDRSLLLIRSLVAA